jgi:hypothetical protein
MGVFLRCNKPSSFSGLPEQKLLKGWVEFWCAWVRILLCGGVGLLKSELCANACCCAQRLAGASSESWEKKRKKCCDRVREKGETKLVRELVSEYYSSNW